MENNTEDDKDIGPTRLKCGHWSWWRHEEQEEMLNGRTREMIMFGPGCWACALGYPKIDVRAKLAEKPKL